MAPETPDSQQRPKRTRPGQRLSLWIRQDRKREFAVDTLDVLGVYNLDHQLTEFDRQMDATQRQIDASKRQVARASKQTALAVYPWLMLAPLGVLIAVKSRAAIKAAVRGDS
jgi:hypothetical protein